ncbi:MAG: crosslink repair DNA glycosylase YcaQ family protein [Gordonia sp. (in: high G+C Gram-positive bacteria)]
MADDLTIAQARRIALVAQGFGDRRPTGAVTARHRDRVIARTGLFQMDSVNVAVRAHYLPLFSRLGPYDRGLLDAVAWGPRPSAGILTEYWAHEAALIPVADWPLFRWRMAEFADGRWRHTRELMQDNRDLAAQVRAVIAEAGPSTPRSIERVLGIRREPGRSGGWWDRGAVKHLCEAMFAAGELGAVRNAAFVRHYDLAERVVGSEYVGTHIDRADAHRRLVAKAAASLGVATVADLADYYRLRTADVRPAVADLVDAGILRPVSVIGESGAADRPTGRREPAYLHADVIVPRRPRPAARPRGTILSPFDPLVFCRPRTERLFGFRYRIEIYVPEHKRVHGYYVHPFLLGDDLVARVDLKADRARGTLLVPGAFAEPATTRGCSGAEVVAALAAGLESMARWLGLSAVEIGDRGDLSAALCQAIGQRRVV